MSPQEHEGLSLDKGLQSRDDHLWKDQHDELQCRRLPVLVKEGQD